MCYQQPQQITVIDATRDLDDLSFQSQAFYMGDCIEVMKRFPSDSIDLVYADPPYNLSKHGLKWTDDNGQKRQKAGGK